MFSGGWSTGSVVGNSSGDGGWSTGSSTGGSGWSMGSTAPAPATTTNTGSGGSYYGTGGFYGYTSPGVTLLGAGLFAGPFGEGGPYTPFNFPLMHELRPGQRLEDLNVQSGVTNKSLLPMLALGILAALLLKGK